MTVQALQTDLTGCPARCPIRVLFDPTESDVRFVALIEATPDFDDSLAAGTFQFGLWRRDCAEIFIADADRKRYIELNLSPSGAWWSCLFESPRVPSAIQPDLSVSTLSKSKLGCWTAELRLPMHELQSLLGPWQRWSINMTVIIGGCDDSSPNPANLHSLVPLDPQSPDFHAPDRFAALELISTSDC